ncbi:hypothetical protein TVAGG3_1029260 [Trichomonas vaginalis G3]|uniref:hypothetical protein n=1 Tax=Trichomonas vaginalis (strain ATCC PRA-98 / G3) TaxID=412133 RepID=UPI0021E61CB0|nr:hypothetical protein TVAGG3_1029260 [Trichomonas vaginalis G3]KAI5492731.1 hypothetical protein TVAGG3_1029260 [Trichomonas vaginalis G3]
MEGQFIEIKKLVQVPIKQTHQDFGLVFDDAFYAVAGYQILANGRIVYSQDNAREEAYITSNSQTTEQIKKVDVFSKTRHEDVWSLREHAEQDKIVSGPITAGKHLILSFVLRFLLEDFTIRSYMIYSAFAEHSA